SSRSCRHGTVRDQSKPGCTRWSLHPGSAAIRRPASHSGHRCSSANDSGQSAARLGSHGAGTFQICAASEGDKFRPAAAFDSRDNRGVDSTGVGGGGRGDDGTLGTSVGVPWATLLKAANRSNFLGRSNAKSTFWGRGPMPKEKLWQVQLRQIVLRKLGPRFQHHSSREGREFIVFGVEGLDHVVFSLYPPRLRPPPKPLETPEPAKLVTLCTQGLSGWRH